VQVVASMARRATRRLGALTRFVPALLGFSLACTRAPAPEGSLAFEREGRALRGLSLATLERDPALRVVATEDPYYRRAKRFRALPVERLLALGFEESLETLRKRSFVLRARDGYAVPIDGSRLLDGHAFVAFDDVDVPGFAPIGPQQVSPAPAYLFWDGAERTELESYPRPWQLSAIAIVDPATLYPHTLPEGEPSDGPAMLGYRVFRERCIRCHAINREGGRVGPDLNVPQSIVSYRPEAQIRAYIRNPLSFRYGAMPPSPDLAEADLDGLIAYFRAMATRPHDLEARRDP
jgi:mono/diheme cytochrome c family protein